MTDHRRVLREWDKACEAAEKRVAPGWDCEVWRKRRAALTAALAALEDRARLRERIEALRVIPGPITEDDRSLALLISRAAVLDAIDAGEPPKGET